MSLIVVNALHEFVPLLARKQCHRKQAHRKQAHRKQANRKQCNRKQYEPRTDVAPSRRINNGMTCRFFLPRLSPALFASQPWHVYIFPFFHHA